MDKSTACCCGTVKHKHRDKEGKEYKSLMSRLNRIEGQVRGIRRMVEDDRYCVDIMTQVSAIQAALGAFNQELLSQHIKSCVVHDIREGDDEVVDELVKLLGKMVH
ncbi:MAG: metal-sensing transcriptional repressor [Selenomonas sp.]|uniref:metal-sensing transcriptional repressor n=1 Tax=Selenomonas sp. TaxID=2053611 RepID=UPI0025CD6AD5|nr:metal-sensing transcriptional repressor [Selenomonas sp.]MCR5757973.1 metal-sensing transcriptional repressor [Selenomonas sp.]